MDLSVIGIILLIGIVKKNSIMLVDFAIAAERDRHLAPEDFIREACLYLDRLQCWLNGDRRRARPHPVEEVPALAAE